MYRVKPFDWPCTKTEVKLPRDFKYNLGKGMWERERFGRADSDVVREEICQKIRITVVKSTKIEMKCGVVIIYFKN